MPLEHIANIVKHSRGTAWSIRALDKRQWRVEMNKKLIEKRHIMIFADDGSLFLSIMILVHFRLI